jgi:hypothetical protein
MRQGLRIGMLGKEAKVYAAATECNPFSTGPHLVQVNYISH